MNLIWIFIEISVNLVEIWLYLYLINVRFQNKTKSKKPFWAALLLGTVGLSFIDNIKWFPNFIFEFIVVLIYALTTRKGKTLQKIYWTIVGALLISATAIAGISIGLLFPKVTLSIILQHTATRFQVLIFCKLIQATLFFYITSRKGSALLLSWPIVISLILVPMTSFSTVLLLFEYGMGPNTTFLSQILLVGASISILGINLIVFVLYESLSKQAENNLQMQARIQQNDLLTRHSEEITGLYEEMRDWRHDYHNHLQVIHGYLQLSKYDKLETYLNQIEKNLSGMMIPINSGNSLIDAIISSKMLLAHNHNIQTHANILVPSNLCVNDSDLCVLLGNLLDNSIEACQRIEDKNINRIIIVEILKMKGHLKIYVKNSAVETIRMSGMNFISEKRGRHHGLGMRHIDEIVGKYNGYIQRNNENGIFETIIMLPLDKILNSKRDLESILA